MPGTSCWDSTSCWAYRLADDLGDDELRLRTLEAALEHPEHPHLPPEIREELELRRPL